MVKDQELCFSDISPYPQKGKFEDLSGRIFGELEILGYFEKEAGKHRWVAQCDCGRIIKTTRSKLFDRGKTSCTQCAENKMLKRIVVPVEDKIAHLAKIIPEYTVLDYGTGVNSSTWKVHCNVCDQEAQSKYHNLYQGTRCCGCKNLARKKLDEKRVAVEKLCSEKNLEFKGFDEKGTILVHLRCPKHDYEWSVRFGSITKGQGCQHCAAESRGESLRTSTEDLIAKFKSVHGDSYGYDKVKNEGYNKRVTIFCNTHKGYFEQIPANHLNGKGCQQCASYGYNPAEPCYLYIFDILDEKGNLVCHKLGITKDINQRLYSQSSSTDLTPVLRSSWYFSTGKEAYTAEQSIRKSEVPFSYLTQQQYSDGYTETFEKEYLEKVKDLAEKLNDR